MCDTFLKYALKGVGLLVLVFMLSACGNTLRRLSEIGEPPTMAKIENPTAKPDYQPVSLPMPAPKSAPQKANSLWRSGSRHFFKDQRASKVGDILTVVINVQDTANLSNETTRSRDASEDGGMTNLFGYENFAEEVLPEGVTLSDLVTMAAKNSNKGTGKIARTESINMQVAAVVTQVLPNGNLVIQGRQEMRVNYELRELQVAGVIRPEDIGTVKASSGEVTNAIPFEKIAEARVSYGGRGHLSDMQSPRYGTEALDILLPF
jgi:flagellar L-ring protein precursor FlgH